MQCILAATAVFVNIVNSHSFHCGSATRCRCSRRRSHIMKNRKEKLKFKPKVNIIDDWTDCSCTPHYYLLSYCACSGLLIVNMHNRAPLVCRSMYDLRSLSEKNVRAPYATVSQTSNLRKHVVRFLLQRRQFDFMMSFVRPCVRWPYAHAKVKSFLLLDENLSASLPSLPSTSCVSVRVACNFRGSQMNA